MPKIRENEASIFLHVFFLGKMRLCNQEGDATQSNVVIVFFFLEHEYSYNEKVQYFGTDSATGECPKKVIVYVLIKTSRQDTVSSPRHLRRVIWARCTRNERILAELLHKERRETKESRARSGSRDKSFVTIGSSLMICSNEYSAGVVEALSNGER